MFYHLIILSFIYITSVDYHCFWHRFFHSITSESDTALLLCRSISLLGHRWCIQLMTQVGNCVVTYIQAMIIGELNVAVV